MTKIEIALCAIAGAFAVSSLVTAFLCLVFRAVDPKEDKPKEASHD